MSRRPEEMREDSIDSPDINKYTKELGYAAGDNATAATSSKKQKKLWAHFYQRVVEQHSKCGEEDHRKDEDPPKDSVQGR